MVDTPQEAPAMVDTPQEAPAMVDTPQEGTGIGGHTHTHRNVKLSLYKMSVAMKITGLTPMSIVHTKQG
jgi:hypothetical protein